MKRTTLSLLMATCASSLVVTGCFNTSSPIDEESSAPKCESDISNTGLCSAKNSEVIDWISAQVESQQQNYYVTSVDFAQPGLAEDVVFDSVNEFDGAIPSEPAQEEIETSETNTIEEGVDEADFVKVIDNRYLVTPKQPKVDYQYVWVENSDEEKEECQNNYYLDDFMILPAVDVATSISPRTSAPYYWGWCDGSWELDNIEITKGKLKVFEMHQTPASSSLTSETHLNPYSNYVNGLYDVLDDTGLLVLSSLSEELPDMRSHYGWWHNKSGIDLIDVSDPINPQASWNIKLDGYVVDTRVLNDELIVVSRRSPYQIELFRNNLNQALTQEQYATSFASIPHETLMGTIQVNDDEPQLLASIDDCLLPKDERPSWGITFTYLTKIDLTDPTNIQTVCTLAPMHSIYMNQESVYFLTSDYNWSNPGDSYYTTNLDRFDIETLEYKNSMTVDGQLGWGIDSKFRIKEQNLNGRDILTLILTENKNWERTHYIKNYEVSDDAFIHLDVYPQAGEKAIGKEREDIFSARIDGDSVQIVTYLNTDPLYEFNISDPSNIWMESELEIPGFSTYLHNIEDTDLTVGLGKTDDRFLKIELYDQSGTDSVVLGTLVMDSRTYSPATSNYKAFTSFDDKDNQRFKIALPIQRWSYIDSDQFYNYTNMAGLWLVEVDYSQTPAIISVINDIEVTDQPNDVYRSRAVIRGEAVHFALNGEVYSTPFDDSDEVHSTVEQP